VASATASLERLRSARPPKKGNPPLFVDTLFLAIAGLNAGAVTT